MCCIFFCSTNHRLIIYNLIIIFQEKPSIKLKFPKNLKKKWGIPIDRSIALRMLSDKDISFVLSTTTTSQIVRELPLFIVSFPIMFHWNYIFWTLTTFLTSHTHTFDSNCSFPSVVICIYIYLLIYIYFRITCITKYNNSRNSRTIDKSHTHTHIPPTTDTKNPKTNPL